MVDDGLSPLAALRRELASGAADAVGVARRCAARANGSASRNTYLHFDEAELVAEAEALPERFPDRADRPALYGIPVSLKDCFDLAGAVTTCGSRFYERVHGVAAEDSAVAARLREAGCLVTGKTHLHPLAYGITGQNAEYGDCLQPRDAGALTGGSSSGAAASVQEGSALAAIGTDTGGSVRVPAALCGLVGFRCSVGLASEAGGWPELWEGGAHLAASFDTLGVLFRDVRDAGALVEGLFRVAPVSLPQYRIECVAESFLFDCEASVIGAYRLWKGRLEAGGARLGEIDTAGWEEATEIFAGIQAHEAAGLHRGHYGEFEAGIAHRLAWGESLTAAQVDGLRGRMAGFQARLDEQMAGFDLLMMPCAPVSRLAADVDPGAVRQKILRYTTPVSLGGLPALALPGEMLGAGTGTGVQVAARAGADGVLLGFTRWVGEMLAAG